MLELSSDAHLQGRSAPLVTTLALVVARALGILLPAVFTPGLSDAYGQGSAGEVEIAERVGTYDPPRSSLSPINSGSLSETPRDGSPGLSWRPGSGKIFFLTRASGRLDSSNRADIINRADVSSWASTRNRADSSDGKRKSPGRALAYSLGGTILFAPLFGTGLIAGPAAGHFYAGNGGQAWIGIGIRSGALLTTGIGMALVWGSTQPTGFKDDPGGGTNPDPPLGDGAGKAGIALAVVGAAALLGSATYDIVTASGAAKKYNRSREVKAQVTPAVGPQGEQVGLSVRVRF